MIMVERICLIILAFAERQRRNGKALLGCFCSLPKLIYDSSNLMAICPNYQTSVLWFNHAMTPQTPLENLQITRPCLYICLIFMIWPRGIFGFCFAWLGFALSIFDD